MKNNKRDRARILAREMQLPQAAIKNTFSAEFRGRHELTVDGCKGIVDYSPEAISLTLGECVMRITGNELEISSFSDEQTVITGDVTGTLFL